MIEQEKPKWDPLLISLLRRSIPDLVAHELCNVQPMSGQTSYIFRLPCENFFMRLWKKFKKWNKSREMFLPRFSEYAYCGCPCHRRGIHGHFHCWGVCCETPNVKFL